MTIDDGQLLVGIALARLPELQTANGLFRETARIEGVEHEGPVTSLLSSTVVLLGLGRAEQAEIDQPFPIGALRTRILGELGQPETTAGELGLALWAETREEGHAISEIEARLKRRLGGGLDRVPTEQLAWILSGLSEASLLGSGVDEALLEKATAETARRIAPKTGLLMDLPHRLREAAAPVTGQLHTLHALCQMIRAGRGEDLRDRAQRLANTLLTLQRDDGGWPGLVDPVRGEAAAWYPALTVTHLAVAPLALRAAQEISLDGDFLSAISAGLVWARGQNALNLDLVHPQGKRIDRGIVPRREPKAFGRGISLVGRRIRGRLPEPDPARLIVDPAAASDDLGWILEAWAGR